VDPSLSSGDPCWFRKMISFTGTEGWVRATIKGVHGVFSEHPSYVVIVDGEEWHGNHYNTKPIDPVTRLGDIHADQQVQAAEVQQGAEGPVLGR